MEMHPGKQMFIDDFFIESMTGARRVLNHPEKITVDAPLHTITPDKPWESTTPSGAVHYDEKNRIFRMYYPGVDSLVCVIESADGIHWERPHLGLVDFEGSRDNNIVNWPGDCPAIGSLLWDPRETDDTYRWKRMHHFPYKGVWQALYSEDGYNWHHQPPGPHNNQKQFFGFGSPAESFGGSMDPDTPYVTYCQRGSSRRTRVLGRRESQDFVNWSRMRTVIDQDLDDPPGTEFYAAGHDMANRTDGGLHIIILDAYSTDLTEPYAIEGAENYWGGAGGPSVIPARIDGIVEPQLTVSRDTISWKRYREPFFHRGEPGSWDWGSIYCSGPVLHDNQLLFYYNGVNLTHNRRNAQLIYQEKSTSAKGLAVLRPDGYVSVEAESYAPGVLTTHRFRQESGGTVTVNADASAGELRYEVLEDTGAPIPGFTAAECDSIHTDTFDAPLTWRGGSGWPGLSEERQATYPNLQKEEFYIKLRFYISPGTKLYSLTLDPPEVTMWHVKVKGRID